MSQLVLPRGSHGAYRQSGRSPLVAGGDGTLTIVSSAEAQAKLGKARKLLEDANALLLKEGRSAEDINNARKMFEDGKALRAEAMLLEEILAESKELLAKDVEAKQAEIKQTDPSKFKRWGEFLFQTWLASNPQVKTAPDPRLARFVDDEPKSHDTKDLTGQGGSSGGYLIPAEFQATLMAAMVGESIVRTRATVIPMRRRQLDIPVLDQTGTTPGRPHWFGGMRFYWTEEGAAKTETEPTFREISLVARKLAGLTRASDELLDDSAISLEAFFAGPMGFAGGVTWMEDYAFLRGTGAGMPLGVINAGATIEVTRNTANTIVFADLANMLMHFLPTGRGVWIAHQSLLATLMQIAGPAGSTAPWLFWMPGGIQNRVPGVLLGYPIIFTEKLPNLGKRGDILLADFSYYLVGDRQSTTVESTRFEKWAEDKTSWRVIHRVDGQPWLSAPLTYEDGDTTVSPFVILSGNTTS